MHMDSDVSSLSSTASEDEGDMGAVGLGSGSQRVDIGILPFSEASDNQKSEGLPVHANAKFQPVFNERIAPIRSLVLVEPSLTRQTAFHLQGESAASTTLFLSESAKAVPNEPQGSPGVARDGDPTTSDHTPGHPHRCDFENIPGKIQGFGSLVALKESDEGELLVQVASDNTQRILGYTPKDLFALRCFTQILSKAQADLFLDQVHLARDSDADVAVNGPEVFPIILKDLSRKSQDMWCAIHMCNLNEDFVICEFEINSKDMLGLHEPAPGEPLGGTNSGHSAEKGRTECRHITIDPAKRPSRAKRPARVSPPILTLDTMTQIQHHLDRTLELEELWRVLARIVKDQTGYHRVMIYRFDQAANGKVVTELVDQFVSKDRFEGLTFPDTDIPKQARELYKKNRVGVLYDRDHGDSRLICRTDAVKPLDLTHSYLRAMSPFYTAYLANMDVRSSMSISINVFDGLWGMVLCHSYGSRGMRISFAKRKLCWMIGKVTSRNIERLTYLGRLHAWELVNDAMSKPDSLASVNPSCQDLLSLFNADLGILSIRDETKVFGSSEQLQEAYAVVQYLRVRSLTKITLSQNIHKDFSDLYYSSGFKIIAGFLLIPLTSEGADFVVFFRPCQRRVVRWAGNPSEENLQGGTATKSPSRQTFNMCSETILGESSEWIPEEIDVASSLQLFCSKFIEIWRRKEAAFPHDDLTRLLLSNSAHETRTPLNAIINYLEMALGSELDQQTKALVTQAHVASEFLISAVINLLDSTNTGFLQQIS